MRLESVNDDLIKEISNLRPKQYVSELLARFDKLRMLETRVASYEYKNSVLEEKISELDSQLPKIKYDTTAGLSHRNFNDYSRLTTRRSHSFVSDDDNGKLYSTRIKTISSSGSVLPPLVVTHYYAFQENLKDEKKEFFRAINDYMRVISLFQTIDPETMKQQYRSVVKQRDSLKNELNEIDNQIRVLSNKVAAIKFSRLSIDERHSQLSKRLNQIAQLCFVSVSPQTIETLYDIKTKCNYILKEKRKIRVLSSPSKTLPNSKVSFSTTANNSLSTIPTISLSSTQDGFLPGTRNTRRAFSAVGSFNDDTYTKTDEHDISTFGGVLGSALVLKFVSKLIVFPLDPFEEEKFEILKPTRIFLSEIQLQNPKIALSELIRHYKLESGHLHLLAYSIDEIHKLDHSFIEFVSIREQLIQKFNDFYSEKIFLEMIGELIAEDPIISCYVLYDFLTLSRINDIIPILLHKIIPQFVKSNSPLDTIPYLFLFTAILKTKTNKSINVAIFNLVSQSIIRTVDDLIKQPIDLGSRTNLLILFSFGKYYPSSFIHYAMLHDGTFSVLQDFMITHNEYPSCVICGLSFFSAIRSFLDDSTTKWYFTYFYSSLIIEFLKQSVRVDVINSYLGVITTIVTNRRNALTDQFNSLHFVRYLMKSIELESLAGERAIPKHIHSQTAITYLNINKSIPKLDLDNPKLQLHFPPIPIYQYVNTVSVINIDYQVEKSKYPIYFSDDIHAQMIQLLFSLLIDHSLHRFDINFVDPFPHVNRKPNILFTLMCHMESSTHSIMYEKLKKWFTPDVPIIPMLQLGQVNNEKRARFGPELDLSQPLHLSARAYSGNFPCFIASHNEDDTMIDSNRENHQPSQIHHNITKMDQYQQYLDFQRLLRLVCPSLFDPTPYTGGQHIASGAFGAVMSIVINGKKHAVKMLQKSRNEFDNPKLVEVYSEVSILEVCKDDRRVTQLIDYGCSSDSYFIVMEYYPTTLKSWRKSLGDNPNIDHLLSAYRAFLKSATILTDRKINHFDIKCDNVMVDACGIPALADFGESMCYKNESNSYTLLNKGTEWIKSPEMLSIALNSSITNPMFDRRKNPGAGPPSDIWSIGCLFYELITGEFLFVDSDWSRFYTRITNTSEPLLLPQHIRMLPNDPKYRNFLEFVLQRSPRRRPNMQQVISKFDEYFPGHEYKSIFNA